MHAIPFWHPVALAIGLRAHKHSQHSTSRTRHSTSRHMRVFSGSTARDPPGGRLTDASDDHADSNDDAARQNQIEGKVLPIILDLKSCASVSMRSHSVHVHRSTAQVGALIQMQTCTLKKRTYNN